MVKNNPDWLQLNAFSGYLDFDGYTKNARKFVVDFLMSEKFKDLPYNAPEFKKLRETEFLNIDMCRRIERIKDLMEINPAILKHPFIFEQLNSETIEKLNIFETPLADDADFFMKLLEICPRLIIIEGMPKKISFKNMTPTQIEKCAKINPTIISDLKPTDIDDTENGEGYVQLIANIVKNEFGTIKQGHYTDYGWKTVEKDFWVRLLPCELFQNREIIKNLVKTVCWHNVNVSFLRHFLELGFGDNDKDYMLSLFAINHGFLKLTFEHQCYYIKDVLITISTDHLIKNADLMTQLIEIAPMFFFDYLSFDVRQSKESVKCLLACASQVANKQDIEKDSSSLARKDLLSRLWKSISGLLRDDVEVAIEFFKVDPKSLNILFPKLWEFRYSSQHFEEINKNGAFSKKCLEFIVTEKELKDCREYLDILFEYDPKACLHIPESIKKNKTEVLKLAKVIYEPTFRTGGIKNFYF